MLWTYLANFLLDNGLRNTKSLSPSCVKPSWWSCAWPLCKA
jgi:hypothetical protein